MQARTPEKNRTRTAVVGNWVGQKTESNPITLKDRYVKQGSPTRMSQEQHFTESKRILDMHINYLSRGCYYYFRDAIARFDDDAMALLRSYRYHESSDQLVTSLTEFYNEREASISNVRRGTDVHSPIRTTSANVASQDRVRSSIERERGFDTIQSNQNERPGSFRNKPPTRSYDDLKQILGFSNRYTFDDVSNLLVKHIQLHGDLNAQQFANLFKRQFPEISKYASFSTEGQRLLDDALDCLFNTMDVDRDGLVDEEELVSGIRSMFAPGAAGIPTGNRVSAEILFAKMDADQDERLYINEVESFVMPLLRKITDIPAVNKTSFTLTLSEMTHNIALFIMRKADVDQNGFIEQVDLTKLSLDDVISYQLLEDLFNLAPDFMDKHRQVISGSKGLPVIGSNKMTKLAGSALRKSLNQDLENLQLQARQDTQQQAQRQQKVQQQPPKVNSVNAQEARKQAPEPIPRSNSMTQQQKNRNRNENPIEQLPAAGDTQVIGNNEVIRGQLQTSAPEALTIKRKAPKTKSERIGDCNVKGLSAEQLRLNPMAGMDAEEEKKGAPPMTAEQKRLNPLGADSSPDKQTMATKVVSHAVKRQQSIIKQDFDQEFKQKSFIDQRDKIINLSKKSGLRQVNALDVARELQKKLQTQTQFNFQEFKSVVVPFIEKKAMSSISMQIYEITLMEIFGLFDADNSGTVDAQELANCMSIMCGGSMTEKINAAFILFDSNASGTMSFDELASLIRTVFNLVKHMLDVSISRGAQYNNEALAEINFPEMAVLTAKKAFNDLQVPQSGEINYQQFVQWITGQNLYTDEELQILANTAPPSKSKFAAKQFDNANEWVKRFLQEEEFIANLMRMRDDCGLQNVSLVRAQMQFAKYKEDGIMDKSSFMKEMRELITACAGQALTDNMRMKMDATLISLYTLFDIDKNGILKSDEVAASLVVLCKGSVASKLKFAIQIFSTTDTETEIKICWREFKTLLLFIFKLSLESSNEILLDYPIDQLAKDVANACFAYNEVTDLVKGEVKLIEIMNFLNKASTLNI